MEDFSLLGKFHVFSQVNHTKPEQLSPQQLDSAGLSKLYNVLDGVIIFSLLKMKVL